jgi:hypothetical protein
MHSESTSILQIVDTQLELLENLNRRLEELRMWYSAFPDYSTEIADVYQNGLAAGVLLKNVEVTSDTSEKLKQMILEHDNFIRKYEALWKSIQERNAMPCCPNSN